ncbi:MAG TPA: hypothetical protein ENK15_03550 [Thermopetrobacter sp.]|nr:hypothetical protein [Thermopetrobacter sp.]
MPSFMPRPLFAVFTLLTFLVTSDPAMAGRCAGARVVQSASRTLLAAANSGSPAAFHRALRRFVNIRTLSLFALGSHARRMTRRQRVQFVRLSVNYIARRLAQVSGSFRGARARIVSCRPGLITSRLEPGGQTVLWRLRGRRIADMRIMGVWLAAFMRDHYRQLFDNAGGDARRFLASLR